MNSSLPGTTMAGRYEIGAVLGRGGMGRVHRAYDRELERDVALKILYAFAAEDVFRLKHEFRALADLRHPNLVELFELVVEDDGTCFFTMELVDGTTLLQHVRADPGGGCDVERLLDATLQLCAGLSALHAAGGLHRDVKPTNILVDRSGRVVLLDFGLATSVFSQASRDSQAGTLVGTLAYMAPEQIAGEQPGPAADWYGVGAVLYEALTGRLPYDDASVASLLDRRAPPRPPRTLVPALPPGVEELTMDLLDPDPARRPSARDIVRRVEMLRGRVAAPVEPASLAGPARIVGRDDELGVLQAALADARAGRSVLVAIEGVSGIGKTAVVRQFADDVEQERDTLVLRARCQLQESVPFKAVDGLVDALSRFLVHRPQAEVELLRPRTTAALCRVFPVLGRVPAFAAGGAEGGTQGEPREVRRRAFATLRELFRRLADRRTLVLWIDDIQWADLDSAVLLRHLRAPADAPPMLVVLSFRGERAGASPAVLAQYLHGPEGAEPPRFVRLEALARDHARTLAEQLAHGVPTVAGRAAEFADEAGGNPFFVRELVRHALDEAARGTSGPPVRLDLTRLIEEHVARVSAPAQTLLAMIAVAGETLPEDVLRRALPRRADAAEALVQLRAARLVRAVSDGAVDTYHDRIRETVVAGLGAEAQQGFHRRLAELLETATDPDPQALVTHFLAAGESQRAAEFAFAAAENAAATLAFNRAVEFYRRAIDLKTPGQAPWTLHEKLGDALASAGHGEEAARTFLQAAEELRIAAPADPRITDLSRRAAEQLLRSGYREEGLGVLRQVLASLGERYPRSAARSILYYVANLPRLRWRARRHRSRAAGRASSRELLLLDTYASALIGVSPFDPVRAFELQARHGLLALRTGDPGHVARTLAGEAVGLAMRGGDRNRKRSAQVLVEAERVAESVSDPRILAFVLTTACVGTYFGGRWREALALAARSEKLCRDHARDVAWELAQAQGFRIGALHYLGEWERMRVDALRFIAEAEERDDRYAQGLGRCFASGWLAADQPDEARRNVGMTAAALPPDEFNTQHYYVLLANVNVDLYVGDAASAFDRLAGAWPRLRRSLLLGLELMRIEMSELRARAAIGLLAAPAGRRRDRLARGAARDIRRIAAGSLAHAAPVAAALRGCLHAAIGDATAALVELDRAAVAFARLDMPLHAAAARYRAARLRGGEDGRMAADRQASWMREHGIAAPDRAVRQLLPG